MALLCNSLWGKDEDPCGGGAALLEVGAGWHSWRGPYEHTDRSDSPTVLRITLMILGFASLTVPERGGQRSGVHSENFMR